MLTATSTLAYYLRWALFIAYWYWVACGLTYPASGHTYRKLGDEG
jgi:hypothetical protein